MIAAKVVRQLYKDMQAVRPARAVRRVNLVKAVRRARDANPVRGVSHVKNKFRECI